MNGFTSKLYDLSDWLIKLVYLNILWIIFTLMGLIALGLFPATVAMYAVTRKWIMGDIEIPIFKSFWNTYRKEFLKSNILGVILLVIGYLLYIDLKFFQMTEQALLQPVYFAFVVLIFVFFVILLYIFPVYVHYEFKLLAYIKYSLIAAIGNVFQTIVMIMSSIIIYYLFRFIPGLIPFVGGSLLSIVLMSVASKSFPKMNNQFLFAQDYVVSIEHEDSLMSIDEGFSRAVSNLKSVLIDEQPTDMWWAQERQIS